MKKILFASFMALSLIIGGQALMPNIVEAADVYAGEQTKFDIKQVYYIDDDTLRTNSQRTVITVNVKTIQSGVNHGYKSHKFTKEAGIWYGMSEGNSASKTPVSKVTAYRIILDSCLKYLN